MKTNGDAHRSDPNGHKVLMIAYVFPPFFSIGGSIRVVKFIKYLPGLGWLPVVLTIDDSREYDTQRKLGSESLLKDIPGQVKIYRTAAGEATAEFLEKGRRARRQSRLAAVLVNTLRAVRRWARLYVLLPDTNVTWLPFALKSGREIVKREGINAILATCPPHSAAIIGALLKRLTGRPLVLDFRDDWIDTPWYLQKPWLTRQVERRLEKWAIKTADRVVLVTQWSRNAYRARYPGECDGKFVLIPNGCDLEEFAAVKGTPVKTRDSQFLIVHAGLLSVSEDWRRSPEGFFQALSCIRSENLELADRLSVAFTGHLPATYSHMIDRMGLRGVVKETGHLPQEDYLRLMQSADLLLAINYDGFSTLIPGKIYEYWAVGGPPILLLSCQGAAQSLVEEKNLGIAASAYDVEAIERAILETYHRRQAGNPMRTDPRGIHEYDRKAIAGELARVLSNVLDLGPTAGPPIIPNPLEERAAHV